MADPEDASKPEIDETEIVATEPLSDEDLENVTGGAFRPEVQHKL
jgi:bacteriocin-like protein